jgi:hypothetical protein
LHSFFDFICPGTRWFLVSLAVLSATASEPALWDSVHIQKNCHGLHQAPADGRTVMIENIFYYIKIGFGAQFYFHFQTICVDQDSGKLIYVFWRN